MKKLIYLVLLMVALTFTNADAYLTKANWVGGTVNSTNILLDAETDNDTFDVLLDNNTNDFPNATATVTVFGGACSRPSTCGTREIVKVKASSCIGTHPTRICTLTVNARNQETTTHSGDWAAGSKVDLGATTGIMTEWETAIDLKVTGAASSTDNAIARFDGTTGKLVQDSGITIDDNRNILSNRGHLKFTQETTPGALTCALAGLGAGNVDNGTHYYKVTFVTANGETEAGTASLVVTVTDKTVNGQVALSAIPTGTSGVVTSRKIYRTKAGIASTGTYYLLTTITDNTTTTYTDNIADASLTTAHPISNTTAGGIYVGGNNRIQIDQIGTIFPDSIRLLETGSTPTLYTTIQSGDLTGAGITFTLPTTDGNASELLQTDGAGVLSWTAAEAGDITTVGTCASGNCGIEGGTDIFPFIYEGTADEFETTFAVTDPTTPDKTITFPDKTGTIVLSTDKLSAFAATTSAELAGVLSDESGTDKVAYTTSPVFTTPNIGSATGSITGNAGTATALAADPANCAAGQIALGITAAGVAECTATPSGLTSVGATTFTGALTGTASGNPTTSSTDTFTNKRITVRTGTTTSSATPTINTDNVDMYLITAQAEAITSFTTNLSGTPTQGQKLWISITGTAARAITWGASFEASTVALPTTTVTTARLDVGFVWNSVSNKWRCVATA